MEDTSLFAKNLRFLIKSKDINNSKLERDMGWGKNSVHNYVTGNNEPNYDRTIKIADYFSVSIDALLRHDMTLEGSANNYNSICQVSEEELGNSCFVPNQITTEATQTLLDNLEKKKHRLRHRTVKGYESQVNIFQKYLQEHNLSEMTPEIIKSFLEYLSINDYDNSTVNSYRYLFGSLLGEEMKEQTYKNTEKLKVNPDGAMYFTRPQIIELRDAIEKTYPQLWLGCMMVFYCFARPRSEMLRLKVGDINFYDHTMVFHGDIAKNIKTQTIVVPRPMLDLFFEYGINNYPSSYYIIGKGGQPNKEAQPVNRLGNIHRKVLIQLKYDTEKYIMYSWKNTGIIEAVRAGIDLVSLARQVRHHSLDQLNQYLVKVGAIHCPDLYTHFKTIDQLKPTESVIGQHSSDFLKLLRNAQRHEVLAPNRYELGLIRAEIDRILG